MKDPKNDSTPVLERFGRDKRKRTVVATAERVERRPRLQRDAADSEQPSFENRPERRASYNPHFTADNRPVFEKPHYGDKSRGEGDRPRRSYDDRPRPYGDRPRQYDDKPRSYGDRQRQDDDRPRRSFGDKPRYDGDRHRSDEERPRRSYGDKPAYGEKKFGPKKFGDKPYGEKKFGEKKFGDKKFGDRKFVDKPFKPAYKKHDDKPASYPKFNPEKQTGEMRLNRFIAQSGICSRREADEYIQAGKVTVNGKPVTELGTKISRSDVVEYDGKVVTPEKKCYVLLNKPKDTVTTSDDPNGRTTVLDLVKNACQERIYPVGRLDRNTTGVLLLTNDGDLASKLTHPKFVKKKIYHVWTDKDITEEDMQRIADGIELDDGEIHADAISYVSETDRNQAGIEIHSGRNRIVRRIFEHLGYRVTKLDRVYFAGLTKKNLPRGRWRYLTQEEVNFLRMGAFE